LPVLCAALLRQIAMESGITVPALPSAVLDQLALDPLLGNVRELENLLHRAVALREEDELQFEPSASQSLVQDLAPLSGAAALEPIGSPSILPGDLQGYLDGAERMILIQALRETGFNRTAAAARLGLSLRQIRYRIARLRIDAQNYGGKFDESD
jgi:two-component system response regulator PilR (NtrC family)